MGENVHILKWGASLAVRIPRSIAEQWGVKEGTAIEIIPRGDRLVLRKKAYDLNIMLAAVGPDNLHTEVDAGPPQGDEDW